MGRSLRVRKDCIQKVKIAQRNHGYFSQSRLARELGLSQGTVSNFLNGRPVDWQNFLDLCKELGQNWQDIIDFEDGNSAPEPNPELNLESSLEPIPKLNPEPNPEPLPKPLAHLALEYPEGLLKPGSSFYVDRPPNEDRCYETLQQPGCLIRIKAPRQMGKTSLLAKLLQQAEHQGDRAIYLSLQLVEAEDLATTKTFINWFCIQVTEELQLSEQLIQKFTTLTSYLNSKSACEKYFEGYLLPALEQPLTLVLDEVDRVFETPEIYKNFFSLLRVMHEKSKISTTWERLRLIMAHSTEVYVQIDPNQSPFNVGLPILLPEFTATQVQDLAQRHHLTWGTSEVEQLMQMVGGHPFLIRRAMYDIARQETTLLQVLQTAATETGIYGEHLRRQADLLAQQLDLAAAMREIATAQNPVPLKPISRAKLQSLGLVKVQEETAMPSCELYRQYFRDRASSQRETSRKAT
jgi:transcriptional regulator with XRE-family HTH domain